MQAHRHCGSPLEKISARANRFLYKGVANQRTSILRVSVVNMVDDILWNFRGNPNMMVVVVQEALFISITS